MIDESVIEAFNNRLTIDLNSIKTMTPAQLDRVKHIGSQAETLLRNRELAQFIHQFKFERLDLMTAVAGHTPDDNLLRVAMSNQIAGVDEFVKSLQRAVYFKNRVVTQQNKLVEPGTES